jgi:hypothetical protein
MYKIIAFGYYVAAPALAFVGAASLVGYWLGRMIGGAL